MENSYWYFPIWIFTVVFLGATVGIAYVLFHFYSICPENRVISVSNLAGCFILLILTVIPGVGRGESMYTLHIVTVTEVCCSFAMQCH